MPRRIEIPPELKNIPFRTAEASQFGLTAERIRSRDVDHPFHGVCGVDLDQTGVLGRCLAFEPLLLEGQGFSHVTSLALLGAPIPADVDGRLHLSVGFPRTPPRGKGVTGHSLRRLSPGFAHTLPIADAPSSWCQSASILRREDLVAAGDYLITGKRHRGVRREPLVTLDELRTAADHYRGSPGAAKLTWALPRVRSGVDSRPETLLRLLIVAGRLPEPQVDHPIDVARGVLLHADLAFVAERIALEYEGDGHRVDRVTWARDIERRELMESAGWRVVRVTADDVFRYSAVFVARLRGIIASRTDR